MQFHKRPERLLSKRWRTISLSRGPDTPSGVVDTETFARRKSSYDKTRSNSILLFFSKWLLANEKMNAVIVFERQDWNVFTEMTIRHFRRVKSESLVYAEIFTWYPTGARWRFLRVVSACSGMFAAVRNNKTQIVSIIELTLTAYIPAPCIQYLRKVQRALCVCFVKQILMYTVFLTGNVWG